MIISAFAGSGKTYLLIKEQSTVSDTLYDISFSDTKPTF